MSFNSNKIIWYETCFETIELGGIFDHMNLLTAVCDLFSPYSFPSTYVFLAVNKEHQL